MKFLVLSTSTNECEKYWDGLKQFGDVKIHLYDRAGTPEQAAYAAVKEVAPDMVLYIGSRWGLQPSIATLCRIREIAPSVHLCSDAADPPWHDLLREYHDKGAFTLQVNIDGSRKWPGASSGLTLLTPVDPADFGPPLPLSDRRISLGYGGNAGGGPISLRTIMLSELLTKNALEIHLRSSLPNTYRSYCNYLGQCKASLNVAYSGTETTTQVKGRVLETALAGAVLLETAGSPTSQWFRPGFDYLTYDNADHAIERVKMLQDDPAMAQTMADNLRRMVLAEHTTKRFWGHIFMKLGFAK